MSTLFRTLLYGGFTAEEYGAIQRNIVEANYKSLQIYAPIATIFFCALSISALGPVGLPASNQLTYMISCLTMGVIMLFAHLLARSGTAAHPHLSNALCYLFVMVTHAFSLTISVAHPEYPAVTAIVFLLVNPMLFVERPIYSALITMAATAAVCVTSFWAKDPVIALDDAWNAITFGIVALAVDVFMGKERITRFHQAQRIAYLSKTDTLTQLRNRNDYENRIEDYPRSGAKVLVCAYADANGLRELNNSQGHEAGDELLRTIARHMREQFGQKNTYRIGGDEFVSFVPDGSADEVRHVLEHMQDELSARGFSASCGVSCVEAKYADMRSLVRDAEKEMYEQKRAYHESNAL